MLRQMLRWIPVFILLSTSSGVVAAQDIDALGPAVGAKVPAFSAVDQFGRTQTLESVAGPEGTMIVFYRSADW
jgi:hypothetical protein